MGRKKKTVKTKELAVKKGEITTQPKSINDLMKMALQSNAGVEQLQKLLEMKYKDEERQAKKDYFRALADFQAEIGPIPKSKNVSFDKRDGTKTSYNYAPLEKIDDYIKIPLKNNGLTKRFKIQNPENKIRVGCIITHINGHSEETWMEAPADTSGSKNVVQSNGSTVTYLQRYTLVGALGLTTADEDNDGRTSQKPPPDTRGLNMSAPTPLADDNSLDMGILRLKSIYAKLRALAPDEFTMKEWGELEARVRTGEENIGDVLNRYQAAYKERSKV
jgi:hypothetical protein